MCLFRLHLLTKHRVFSGPGFQLAQELGEAANGGQVLLSQEAWVRLRGSMFSAGFPVVEQLGLYKFNAWPVPIWVYQVVAVAHLRRLTERYSRFSILPEPCNDSSETTFLRMGCPVMLMMVQ